MPVEYGHCFKLSCLRKLGGISQGSVYAHQTSSDRVVMGLLDEQAAAVWIDIR